MGAEVGHICDTPCVEQESAQMQLFITEENTSYKINTHNSVRTVHNTHQHLTADRSPVVQ